jgi:hypothetical protein
MPTDFLKNWNKITRKNISIISLVNKEISTVEYFNSVIYQIYSKMVFKIIRNELVICKPSSIMGNYSIIKYCNMNNTDTTDHYLLSNGVTIRGHNINGKKDKFGDEYVYNTNECIEKKGTKFNRFRNILNRYKNTYSKLGYTNEIDDIVNKWSIKNKSKHQIKLLKVIKEYLDLVTITRVYNNNNNIIGFSIIENINNKNGVIIQRLINPDIIETIIEPNILIHYHDCINNPNKYLNIGAGRTKNIKNAKHKLRPYKMLKINRKVSNIKLSKKEWFILKENII